MFDLLKKRLSSFSGKLGGRLEKKAEEKSPPECPEKEEGLPEKERRAAEEAQKEIKEELKAEGKGGEIREKLRKEAEKGLSEEAKAVEAVRKEVEEELRKEKEKEKRVAQEKERKEREKKEKHEFGEPEKAEEPEEIEGKKEAGKEPEKERKAEVRLTAKSRLKRLVSGKVKIEEKDLTEFLDEMGLALLESDVEQETAQEIISGMRKELVGKEFSRREDISESLKKDIREALGKVMQTHSLKLLEEVKKKKPFIILFLGPNGAGKTTSIAKIAFLLQEHGKKCIMAAADTFRAASIEQLEKHAQKLGVRLVKHSYGADPAAVAFDAVKAAEAKGLDVVLIDSAGRQETNKNLMNELKKINRVVKPDLKVFVGEAMAGNTLLEQAKQFNEWVGVDGFVLTKIDTDAKGGTSISLLHNLKKPILFVGTGQKYADLLEFRPEFILNRVVA